jgi:Tfp pilus assembly protein PilN
MYHGRILLPPDYPFKPPHIIFLTPSGRFETSTKICLSFSAFHPELWQPAWGIRLILEALIAFLPTPADGAIGALDWSSAERKRLALQSQKWCCPQCGRIADLLPLLGTGVASTKSQFTKEIEELQRLQQRQHAKREDDSENTEVTNNQSTDGQTLDDLSAAVESPTATSISEISNPVKVAVVTECITTSSANDGDLKPRALQFSTDAITQSTTTAASAAAEPSVLESFVQSQVGDAVAATDNNSSSHGNTTSNAIMTSQRETREVTSTVDTPMLVQETDTPAQRPVTEAREEDPLLVAHPPVVVQPVLPPPQQSFWLSDPLLQTIMVVLAMIVYLLMRKVQVLLEDLRALEQTSRM